MYRIIEMCQLCKPVVHILIVKSILAIISIRMNDIAMLSSG